MTDNFWKFALAGGLLIVAGYGSREVNQGAVYQFVGLASVVCILVGVRIHRPINRAGWILLAVGGTFFTLGDAVGNIYAVILHLSIPFPSIADAFYLAGYPFVFAGILKLTRNPHDKARREDYTDTAMVSLGALAFSWSFLIAPTSTIPR